MLFEKLLMPDEVYPDYKSLTPQHVGELGKKYIFSDIDNTLATYDDILPPEDVILWYNSMRENGISVVFVSNNDEERVARFASAVPTAGYAKAKKPLTSALRNAMRECGAAAEESLLLGDQLLTDCACAKRAGLFCVIVPPIKDKKSLFFRFKRLLEKPYMRKFMKNKMGKH